MLYLLKEKSWCKYVIAQGKSKSPSPIEYGKLSLKLGIGVQALGPGDGIKCTLGLIYPWNQ